MGKIPCLPSPPWKDAFFFEVTTAAEDATMQWSSCAWKMQQPAPNLVVIFFLPFNS